MPEVTADTIANSYAMKRVMAKASAVQQWAELEADRKLARAEWDRAMNGVPGKISDAIKSQFPDAVPFDFSKVMPQATMVVNAFNAGKQPVPFFTSSGDGKAAYSPSLDLVAIPPSIEGCNAGCQCEHCQLVGTVDLDRRWCRILFHELSHATGHWSRLARFTIAGVQREAAEGKYSATKRPSDAPSIDYILEEVVAEWSAMNLMEHVGLMDTPMRIYMSKYAEGYLRGLGPKAAFFTGELRHDADAAADFIIKAGAV